MAPKMKTSPVKDKASGKKERHSPVKKKAAFAKQATKKTPVDTSKVRLVACALCGQSSHDWDRDFHPKKVKVAWRAYNWSTRNQINVPQGRECGLCYSTRRRYFEEGLEEFEALLKTNDQLVKTFGERRADKAVGGTEFASAKRQKASTIVVKKKGNFTELFEEGACTGLARWCREQKLSVKGTEGQLKQRIQEAFPGTEIGKGRGGKLVVFEVGRKHGGDYRFRRGINEATQIQKREEHSDDEFAKHTYENDSEDGDGEEEEGGDVGNGVEDGNDEDDAEEDGSEEEAGDEGSEVSEEEEEEETAPSKVRLSTKSCAGGSSSAKGSKRAAPTRRGSTKEASEDGDEDSNGDLSENEATPKPKRLTAAEKLREKATKLEQRAKKKHDPELVWNKRTKVREHKRLLDSLGATANALSRCVANPEAKQHGQRLFKLQELLGSQWEFAEAVRDDVVKAFAMEPTKMNVAMLNTFPAHVQANMLTTGAFSIMSMGSENWWLVLAVAVFKPGDNNPMLLSSGRMSGAGPVSGDAVLLAAQTQTGIVQTFVDAVIKNVDEGDLHGTLSRTMEKAEIDITSVDIRGIDVGKEETAPKTGFFNQPLFDLRALMIMANVLRSGKVGLLLPSFQTWSA